MYHATGMKGIYMLITTRTSLHTSLRRLRRTMTAMLILANFAATRLADAYRGGSPAAPLIGSLLICLFLIVFTSIVWGKTPVSFFRTPLAKS